MTSSSDVIIENLRKLAILIDPKIFFDILSLSAMAFLLFCLIDTFLMQLWLLRYLDVTIGS